MRDIKFSIAYSSPFTDEPNKWLISDPLTIEEIMFGSDTQVDFTNGGYLRFHEMQDVESTVIFRRYTGLKDKNDREIYEFDIVRTSFDNEIGVVEFCDDVEHMGWTVSNPKYGEIDLAFNGYPEIIGNIYENPEILAKEGE